MLLTLTTTTTPATDLGYLLHKHPDRTQAFEVSAGTAHVFYPVAGPTSTTAALLLDVDPIALARGRSGGSGHYVDDRPYTAGSLLAVAIGKVFGSALHGRCDARPELAATPIPLTAHLPTLPCRGGPDLVPRLFEPLGWRVRATPVPLDPAFPDWGDAPFVDTTLTGELRLADALSHLYVLLPVLDGGKHYWVAADEVDKLLRAGAGWLAGHPERELITERYLAHQRGYVSSALARLAEADGTVVEELDNALVEARPGSGSLATRRRAAVLAELRAAGARRVLDLGCGAGALLRDLLADRTFTEIVGVEVSTQALAAAERRLPLDQPPARGRLTLRRSALTYVDPALAGYDAAVLMEVIEHVDPERLPALERAVFGVAHPATVVLTTPNAEFNVRYPGLPAGAFRHPDHRFEWTRSQLRDWASGVAERHGYRVRFEPVGDSDPELGPATQLAVFSQVAVEEVPR